MLPFLTGHWRINEQVAKRQCNYIDGVFFPSRMEQRHPHMHKNMLLYMGIQNLKEKKTKKKNTSFFFIYAGVNLHTLHLSW